MGIAMVGVNRPTNSLKPPAVPHRKSINGKTLLCPKNVEKLTQLTDPWEIIKQPLIWNLAGM